MNKLARNCAGMDQSRLKRVLQWRRLWQAFFPTSRRLHFQLAIALLFFVTPKYAKNLPAGIAIPVTLNSDLNAEKDEVGQKIEGKLMQEIRVPSGFVIKSGSHVLGHIVEVVRPTAGGSRIAVTFDELDDHGRIFRLSVSLRAVVSFDSVHQAGLPINASSDYESSDEWVTKQVGGDVVNRGRGLVGSGAGIVGKWSRGDVWAKLTPAPQAGCPADDGNDREQALWIFSTSACGVYGLPDLKLANAGRADPVGRIVFESDKTVMIRGGSGWLLVTRTAPPASH